MSFTPDEKSLDAEIREVNYIGQRFDFSEEQTTAMFACKAILQKATEDCLAEMNKTPHHSSLRAIFRHAMVAAKDLCCSAINLGIPKDQEVRTGKRKLG